MTEIVVCDDHPIVRNGLKRLLNDEIDMTVVGEASNVTELIQLLKTVKPAIVVLDISMPGLTGYEALAKLKTLYPQIKILMLSALSEDLYTYKTLKAGASGYLNKESAPEELVKAVRKIMSGGTYISPAFAEKLAFDFKNDIKKAPHERLSDREFQILTLIGSGKSVSEISQILNLSVKTVSTYRSRILDKMDMKNNAELMKYCINENLIE